MRLVDSTKEGDILEKINIFGVDMLKYKLFGIYISSRKPKQSQNITSSFAVSTLIEYYEFDYSCEFQWLNKYEKEKILNFILKNNGNKIKINSKLFNEREGLISVKVGNDNFFEVLANYENISVTRKTNDFFDLKINLKIIIDLKPATWLSLKTKTWAELKTKTWEEVQNGGA